MNVVIESFRRDHREAEALLRALEGECDLFRQAERPDYELIGEIIAHFRSFLDEYYHPKEEMLFNLTRTQTGLCDSMIDRIADERAASASSLEALRDALGEILNEQRVLRQTFDDAARGFIQHERRRIEIEEQRLFPELLSVLGPAAWAELAAGLRDQRELPRRRGLEERLRARSLWISREALADQAERTRPAS